MGIEDDVIFCRKCNVFSQELPQECVEPVKLGQMVRAFENHEKKCQGSKNSGSKKKSIAGADL